MALKVNKGSGGDFELVPEGQYTGRCYRVIDLGIQESKFGLKEQVFIAWELIGTDDPRMADGRPFSVSSKYTASLDERSILYRDINSWRGKKFTEAELNEFDLTKVLGAYCTIQVVHNESGERTYANVQAIMAFKGTKPEGVNEALSYDTTTPDKAVFDKLPEFLQKMITAGEHAQKLKTQLGALTGDTPIVIEDLEPSTTSQINIEDVPF